jgi:hypothetical protein
MSKYVLRARARVRARARFFSRESMGKKQKQIGLGHAHGLGLEGRNLTLNWFNKSILNQPPTPGLKPSVGGLCGKKLNKLYFPSPSKAEAYIRLDVSAVKNNSPMA